AVTGDEVACRARRTRLQRKRRFSSGMRPGGSVRRRVLPSLWAIFARPIRRRSAYAIVVAAAVIPRLLVVAHERHNVILPPELVEKNVFFARTFVHSGTFGYVPGVPSADDQPLYGFFLIPLYWLFNGHWLSIALAQTF